MMMVMRNKNRTEKKVLIGHFGAHMKIVLNSKPV